METAIKNEIRSEAVNLLAGGINRGWISKHDRRAAVGRIMLARLGRPPTEQELSVGIQIFAEAQRMKEHREAEIERAKEQAYLADLASRGLRLYHCWAEHTAGGSVDHCCRTGVFVDPTDGWQATVEAANEDDAYRQATQEFEKTIDEYLKEASPCACGRFDGTLYDSWHNSVCVTVSHRPYPDYVGDDN